MHPQHIQHYLAELQHEIRQPLHTIVQLCEELKLSYTDQQQQHIIQQIENLSFFISDVVQSQSHTKEAATFSLRKVFISLENLIHQKAKIKNIDVVINIAPSFPDVWYGHAHLYLQLLHNLVENAIKYTPSKGRVTLSIRKDHGLEIRVQDNGKGIPSSMQSIILQPFVQLNEEVEGQGLGWSIIRKIIKQLDGNWRMKSEEDSGTTIDIQIPTMEVEDQPIFPKNTQFKNVGRVSILIVEDHEINRKSIRQFIEQKNSTILILEAKNGEEALDLLQRHRFSCVLLDIQLPQISGIETIRRIRQQLGLQIPVIGMSAGSILQFMEEDYFHYFNDYLEKPFSPDMLLEKITSYINSFYMNKFSTVHQYINLSYLNLMADDDQHMKKLMLSMLLDEIPAEIKKMNLLYQQEEWDDLRRVSHKMKTTLSFVGNELLTITNQSIERIVKAQADLAELPDLFGILNEMFPKVIEELREVHNACQV
ncbi:MAG: response regulator [Bacteroidota bacterium]